MRTALAVTFRISHFALNVEKNYHLHPLYINVKIENEIFRRMEFHSLTLGKKSSYAIGVPRVVDGQQLMKSVGKMMKY